jgi:hypothetical protein
MCGILKSTHRKRSISDTECQRKFRVMCSACSVSEARTKTLPVQYDFYTSHRFLLPLDIISEAEISSLMSAHASKGPYFLVGTLYTSLACTLSRTNFMFSSYPSPNSMRHCSSIENVACSVDLRWVAFSVFGWFLRHGHCLQQSREQHKTSIKSGISRLACCHC